MDVICLVLFRHDVKADTHNQALVLSTRAGLTVLAFHTLVIWACWVLRWWCSHMAGIYSDCSTHNISSLLAVSSPLPVCWLVNCDCCCICWVYVVFSFSDDDSMDVDSSHAAANLACVLNFVKKMLAIVSLVFLPVWCFCFLLFFVLIPAIWLHHHLFATALFPSVFWWCQTAHTTCM